MTFAQIKDGVVKNVIVLDDLNKEEYLGQNFDYIIQIDSLDPEPGIGWIYDPLNNEFNPPASYEELSLVDDNIDNGGS